MVSVEQRFDSPRIAINRVYTRLGDAGQTSLAGGQRVQKDSPRLECYGTLDELSATLGVARATAEELSPSLPALEHLATMLLRVQHELFNLGSILATLPEDVRPRQARITGAEIERLEREMDVMNEQLPTLRSFVLPGGSRLNAELHVCRTVCRRAERALVRMAREEPSPEHAVPYLNRLSDALFVWSRWASETAGAAETLWNPNLPATENDKDAIP
ncbi:MAG: cob(I)yrinic acid a,c-diamide adenosyltransferase [Acidobacteria bacterium]|nr:cob(I)yrinic acid a,c-diamide adenosyltransferase [Acidobacteriota bacterium]